MATAVQIAPGPFESAICSDGRFPLRRPESTLAQRRIGDESIKLDSKHRKRTERLCGSGVLSDRIDGKANSPGGEDLPRSCPCRAPIDQERRGTDDSPQVRQRACLRLCAWDQEPLVTHFPDRCFEAMTAPSRDFLAKGPRRVVIAAAGPRTDEGQSLRRRTAALCGGSAHALQEQDALMCEPEVLSDGRLI